MNTIAQNLDEGLASNAVRVIWKLRHSIMPISAIALADYAEIGGNREARRRGIRLLVRALRERGYPICANNDGYWLARHGGEWSDYTATRRAGAVFAFVDIRTADQAVSDRASGQGALFEGGAKREGAFG